MPGILEPELKKQISSGCFSNVYLLYGDEKYLIRHYSNLIIKKSVRKISLILIFMFSTARLLILTK